MPAVRAGSFERPSGDRRPPDSGRSCALRASRQEPGLVVGSRRARRILTCGRACSDRRRVHASPPVLVTGTPSVLQGSHLSAPDCASTSGRTLDTPITTPLSQTCQAQCLLARTPALFQGSPGALHRLLPIATVKHCVLEAWCLGSIGGWCRRLERPCPWSIAHGPTPIATGRPGRGPASLGVRGLASPEPATIGISCRSSSAG